MQTYRLTNEAGGLGLSCTTDGLSLAGTALLHKTVRGFSPRAATEIALLMKAAYGADGDGIRLEASLGLIARALNSGEPALAAIAAVLTRTPELSSEAARRLAAVNDNLTKYNPDQPRDWHGRWASEDGSNPAGSAAPRQGEQPATATSPAPRGGDIASGQQPNPGSQDASPAANASAARESDAPDDRTQSSIALEQVFASQYDDLGPIDFAKLVLQFGDQLSRNGANFAPTERDRAIAEYTFLEDRLSFWLAYEYTPPTAKGNLLSAAQALFQGAILSGIGQPGHLPKSMLDAATDIWANANPPLTPRFPFDAATEIAPETSAAPEAPLAPSREVEGLGGSVDNSEARIVWSAGIREQGKPFETYVGTQFPNARQLSATATAFDQFDSATGTAISDKTLNTLSVSYVRNPQQIYARLRQYVDSAADYEPRTLSDIDPTKIQTKMIQLAIPEYTSPTQWRYLFWALRYARERGVSIAITRVQE
jgi:hypothetical protein